MMTANGHDEDSEWSFLTFCRIRPPSLQSLSRPDSDQCSIQYRISDGENNAESDGKKAFKVLAMEIPGGADPGLVHNNPSGFVSFTFNEVFDIDATQDDVFNNIRSMVLDIFRGINSTVLAYGQTGSGKTYNICGGNTYGERGLIPRSISLVFEELAIRREESDDSVCYKCLVSFTEVYGENLYDLLDPNKRNVPLEEWQKVQILEGEDGLVLKNINVFEVEDEEEVLNLFFMGTTNRSISSTKMNNASSRSHAIFTMVVETEQTIGNRKTYSAGKVNLVDLAGSERLYKVNNSRTNIKEGKSINLSLHYLEQVILSLRDSHRNPPTTNTRASRRASRQSISGLMGHHIPYRNSVLTNILRDSLGGNCKSCFLLTMAADVDCFEESVSTARFGQRCGEIQVKVHANLEVDVHSQLREARQRVHQLQYQVNHLEEEQLNLRNTLREKQSLIDDALDPKKILSNDDERNCDILVRNLCESLEESGEIRDDINEQLGKLSKSSQLCVIRLLGQRFFEVSVGMRRQESNFSDMSSATVEAMRAKGLLERNQSSWSFDDEDGGINGEEGKSVKSEDAHSRLTLNSSVRPSDEKLLTDEASFAHSDSRQIDISTLVAQSKRVRQLLEGVTVVTFGAFGKHKTKYLSLSQDLSKLIWQDILNNTSKTEDIKTYRSFAIDESKSPQGVMVTYEHKNKHKKMEFPRNNLSPEENKARVQKWIDLLNSLRDNMSE